MRCIQSQTFTIFKSSTWQYTSTVKQKKIKCELRQDIFTKILTGVCLKHACSKTHDLSWLWCDLHCANVIILKCIPDVTFKSFPIASFHTRPRTLGGSPIHQRSCVFFAALLHSIVNKM